MATPRTYGSITEELPKGMLCRVDFPELMRLDVRTYDGRLFDSGGFSVMEEMMPFPLKFRPETKDGHDDALAAGRLDFIEVHADGRVSGSGWASKAEAGPRLAVAVATKTCRTNSADLRDCRMKIKFPDFEEMFKEDEAGYVEMPRPLLNFPECKLAGTTIVAMPAFATAFAEVNIDELPDELFASFHEEFESEIRAPEMSASGGGDIISPYDDFFFPEADRPTKIVVDGLGRVFGHLGTYDEPHTSMAGRRFIPRSRSNYASFNKPGVLTDNGLVSTGPIFLLGGHPKAGSVTPETINKAYGDIENTWADVRLSDGRFGPWISGRVRPGTPPEKVYAARASRISGHWLNDELFAIVSCNAEGFEVEGNDEIEVEMEDGRVLSLVASFSMGTVDDADQSEHASDHRAEASLAFILLDPDD